MPLILRLARISSPYALTTSAARLRVSSLAMMVRCVRENLCSDLARAARYSLTTALMISESAALRS
jgi:hypothetical protein